MLNAIRQSILVPAGLLLFVIGVAFCPHASHASMPHGHQADAMAEHESDGNHGCDHELPTHVPGQHEQPCQLDEGHSHDFRISSPQQQHEPILSVVAVIPLDAFMTNERLVQAAAHSAADDAPSPLTALDSIRLRL